MTPFPVNRLAECKGKCLNTGIKKFNFKCPVFHRTFLANELIEAMFLHGASAAGIHVNAAVFARSSAIQFDLEADGLAAFGWTENQMQITAMESEDNFAGRGLKHSALGTHLPGAAQSPLI